MASYAEIRALFSEDQGLRNKVEVAVIVAAKSVADDPANFPTTTADSALQTARQEWATRALSSTQSEAIKAFKSVLAANKDATVAQITGATDAAIQTNVNNVVDLLAQFGA